MLRPILFTFLASLLFAAPLGADDKTTKSLFDGKSLKGWKVTEFEGHGDVEVKEGAILLHEGADITGINYTGELPRDNYELRLEAKRVKGSDFFCGLTFPVGDEPCSLIVGGWGGGVIGLSSINGFDASENETTQYEELENDRWYKIRLRVTPKKIAAWIDDKQYVDVDRAEKKFSVRIEVELSKPLGIATWQTGAALRNIELERLK